MNFHLILKNVSRHIELDSDEESYFKSLLIPRKIRRRQYVVQQGDICRFETFVTSGCLRAYYVDESGTEHVVQFAIEDWWTGDIASFITQTPASLNVDALEESEILQISRPDMEELYRRIPKFERFYRIMLQKSFVAQQQRLISTMTKNAETRYLEFRQKYAALEKRIPQTQIASYLGITPEFLSKIRKNLSSNL